MLNPTGAEDAGQSKFYMDVPKDLKERFQQACGSASMTAVTQQLWRIFVNSPGEDKYDIIQESSRNTS